MADLSSGPYVNPSDGDDYGVVHVSLSWGFLSLLAFLVVVTFQLFGSEVLHLQFNYIIFSTLILSPVGFVLGLIGLKFGRSPQIAKVGVFLNGVVLFCIFVLLPVTFAILRSLR